MPTAQATALRLTYEKLGLPLPAVKGCAPTPADRPRPNSPHRYRRAAAERLSCDPAFDSIGESYRQSL